MSTVKYKKTKFDDERPLASNEEISTQPEVIELQDNISSIEYSENTLESQEETEENQSTQIVYKKRRVETIYLAWAIVVTFFLIVFIIIAVYAHPGRRDISWCCISQLQLDKCKNMSLAFYSSGFAPKISCILTENVEQCVHKIDKDTSDVISISSSDLYNYRDILKPILTEDYALKPSDGFGSYLVAVLPRNNSINLSNSTGTKACVMDLNYTVGYFALNHLTNPTMSSNNCNAKSSFLSMFNSACVPSDTVNLCSGCKQNVCPHEKNGGCKLGDSDCIASKTINCLLSLSENNVVAFLDHITVMKKLKDNSEYNLLCPNGSKTSLSNYKTCNFGQIPANSIVVSSKIRSGVDIEIPSDIVEILHISQLYFGSHGVEHFNMFSSPTGQSLLFKEYSRKLVPLKFTCSAQEFLGLKYMNIQASLQCTNTSQKSLPSCLFKQYT